MLKKGVVVEMAVKENSLFSLFFLRWDMLISSIKILL